MNNFTKRLFNSSRRSLSLDSCEEVVGGIDSCEEISEEKLSMGKSLQRGSGDFKEIVGQVVDYNNEHFILVPTDCEHMKYELHFPNCRYSLEPELSSFYKCAGTVVKAEDRRLILQVDKISKLERGCRELEERIKEKKFDGISSLFRSPAGMFEQDLIFQEDDDFEDEEEEETFYDVVDHNTCTTSDGKINCRKETIEDLMDDTLTNNSCCNRQIFDEPPENVQRECNRQIFDEPPENVQRASAKSVPAIVVSIDRVKNTAILFALWRMPLLKFSFRSFKEPLKIGQWFSVRMPLEMLAQQTTTTIVSCPELAPPTKMLEGEEPPLRMRISSNGEIHFFTCAHFEGMTEGGFLSCSSKHFPLIIDSSSLLTHLVGINNGSIFRSKSLKIWCCLRRAPLDGIWWKITKIAPMLRKQQIPFDENEERLVKEKKLAAMKTAAEAAQKLLCQQTNHRQKQQRSAKVVKQKFDENTPLEGLVCAQTVDEFFVYVPSVKIVARLAKKSCKGRKLLGIWIKFRVNMDGRRVVVADGDYTEIEPKILTIPSKDYVLLRCTIDVQEATTTASTARGAENKLAAHCAALNASVWDVHGLLKPAHQGRSVKATIGYMVVQPMTESGGGGDDDEDAATIKIHWELLHAEEVGNL